MARENIASNRSLFDRIATLDVCKYRLNNFAQSLSARGRVRRDCLPPGLGFGGGGGRRRPTR